MLVLNHESPARPALRTGVCLLVLNSCDVFLNWLSLTYTIDFYFSGKMFRLKVSDKFGHVLSKLQAMITSNQKYCSQINLPKFIILEDLDKNEGLELRARIDSVYKEKELTVAVKFQFQYK